MNPALVAKLTGGIRKVQKLWGETVVIAGVSYPAILGQESSAQSFSANRPLEEVVRLPISIARADLALAPAPGGGRVTARGREWRIFQVATSQTTYDLVLETPNK